MRKAEKISNGQNSTQFLMILRGIIFKQSSILDVEVDDLSKIIWRSLVNVHMAPVNLKKYIGVDASEDLLLEARTSFPNTQFIISTMQDYLAKFGEESVYINVEEKYEAIIFLASFHHLENETERIRVLKNAEKILASNGKIYLTNWNLL